MARPDHVIIGTGINALVAGAMLAMKGKKVLLLERNSIPGGCMRTEEITLPGFHHDVMAATWVLFLTSPAGAALGPTLPGTVSIIVIRRIRPPCCAQTVLPWS